MYAKEAEEMVHYFTILEIGENVIDSNGNILKEAVKVEDAFSGEVYWKDRELMLFSNYDLTGEYMYFVNEEDPNLK